MEAASGSSVRTIRPPGDKSLSHRALILSPLARGTSRLRGLLEAADVRATAEAMRALGAEIEVDAGGGVEVSGPVDLRKPEATLDCGNSGTSARLLLGLLAGLGVDARVDGDASLRRRPMDRIVYPLQAMGARLSYEGERGRLPVRVHPRATGSLRRLRHRPRVASAQVKSSLLLAGLVAPAEVEVIEPGRSRDHTERLLRAMGAPVEFGPEGPGSRVRLAADGWTGELRPLEMRIPSDPSSAAFLLAAGLLSGRALRAEGVGLNPTRTGFLEVLEEMGVEVDSRTDEEVAGEPVGHIAARAGTLRAFDVGPELVPRVLDEIPVLAVLGARAAGTSRLRGAEELRVKESDRLAVLARGLRSVGVRCRELPDGLEIEGTRRPLEGEVETEGDHRIAMAFGVLGAAPGARVRVDDRECVSVSFPGFWEALADAVGAEQGGGASASDSSAGSDAGTYRRGFAGG